MADVNRINFCGAALQQAIGKTSRGRADIQRDLSVHVDFEMIESAFQLQCAAPHIFACRLNCDRRLRIEKLRCLYRKPSADLDLPGHHGALRLLAACEQALLDQKLIKP